MPSLSDILLSANRPDGLVPALATTLETHVAAQSGLKGLAMKTGYNLLRSAKPDLATRAVNGLLPSIVTALEPLYAEFQRGASGDFGQFLQARAPQAVAMVASAVEQRVMGSGNSAAQSVFRQFKGSVGDELTKLLPSVGRVLSAHLPRA